MITKYLGAETAVSWLGEPPVVAETMEMPPLPEVKKTNTDVSVYNKAGSEIRQQGKDFNAAHPEKRKISTSPF